jgi:hypothetical protein
VIPRASKAGAPAYRPSVASDRIAAMLSAGNASIPQTTRTSVFDMR